MIERLPSQLSYEISSDFLRKYKLIKNTKMHSSHSLTQCVKELIQHQCIESFFVPF